jgi:hypothetical protein
MSDDSQNPDSSQPKDEAIVSLTDLIDRLEQRAFMRNLDERHPFDRVQQPIDDAESA